MTRSILCMATILIVSMISCNTNGESDVVDPSLNVKLWPTSKNQFYFPESELGIPKTGVCLSGGGTRAMVCGIGQLKGLYDLGVIDSVGYLSCVSGGSWVSVPFTYYRSGADNDDQLLGTYMPPGELTMKNLNELKSSFLGSAANASFLDTIFHELTNTNFDRLWLDAVGKCYMQPFGIYSDDKDYFYSYNDSTVNEILARNRGLSKEDFLTVHSAKGDAHRPYLVVNSSISGPYSEAPFVNPEQLAVFNYTPLYIGSAQPLNTQYTSEKDKSVNTHAIGGGFIEPFAFGDLEPDTLPVPCNPNSKAMCVEMSIGADTFSIADASGTSSSAFVADLTSFGIKGHSLKGLSPQVDYWPIPNDSIVSGINYMFGDGGNLENFGLITLLQRGVERIVVFVNTSSAINTKYDFSKAPTKHDIDSDILPLFGYSLGSSSDMNQNQVFAQTDFDTLMRQFVDCKTNGTTVMAQTNYVTTENDWWGVPANDTVDILWVYNEEVQEWRDSLEWEIKAELDLGIAGAFPHFPRYALVGEDGALVRLSAREINLLYQLSAWNVKHNAEAFEFLK